MNWEKFVSPDHEYDNNFMRFTIKDLLSQKGIKYHYLFSHFFHGNWKNTIILMHDISMSEYDFVL